jgi:Protein of unknown function (DUF1697).
MVYVALLRGINVGGKNKIGISETQGDGDFVSFEQYQCIICILNR